MVVSTAILDSGSDSFGSNGKPVFPAFQRPTAYDLGVPRPRREPPRAFTESWPGEPCTDPVAEVARRFAVGLTEALGGRSLRSVRDVTGVEHTTLSGILSGQTWPDLATIARLERGLAADLWPGRIVD